jgi:hypothetical protein
MLVTDYGIIVTKYVGQAESLLTVNLKVFVSVIVSGLSQEVEPHAIKLV